MLVKARQLESLRQSRWNRDYCGAVYWCSVPPLGQSRLEHLSTIIQAVDDTMNFVRGMSRGNEPQPWMVVGYEIACWVEQLKEFQPAMMGELSMENFRFLGRVGQREFSLNNRREYKDIAYAFNGIHRARLTVVTQI